MRQREFKEYVTFVAVLAQLMKVGTKVRYSYKGKQRFIKVLINQNASATKLFWFCKILACIPEVKWSNSVTSMNDDDVLITWYWLRWDHN